MHAQNCSAMTARPNPVGVVGFVPTAAMTNPKPTGMTHKPAKVMHPMTPKNHAASGPKKPHSLN